MRIPTCRQCHAAGRRRGVFFKIISVFFYTLPIYARKKMLPPSAEDTLLLCLDIRILPLHYLDLRRLTTACRRMHRLAAPPPPTKKAIYCKRMQNPAYLRNYCTLEEIGDYLQFSSDACLRRRAKKRPRLAAILWS